MFFRGTTHPLLLRGTIFSNQAKDKGNHIELRQKIAEAYNKREGYTGISKHFTVLRTAVRCIIAKCKETNSVRNKPGRGFKCNILKKIV